MKKSKRMSTIVYLISAIVICVVVNIAINKYNSHKLTEAFDTIDRLTAIEQLSKFQGMILEIKSLSYQDTSQDILMNELERITNQKDFTNPYLKDFVFVIPDTSNIGDFCEELISQIDDQIHTIEFETKGE